MSGHVSVDFETFYGKGYSVKTMIAESYCRDARFDPYLISVSDGSQCWAGEPKNFNWDALDGKVLVSHNRYFDNTVYNEMVRRGLAPQIKYAAWHCTSNLTSYLCNRRALDQAIEYLYKVKVSKAARADAANKRWQDFSDLDRASMIKYAAGDANWCHRIFADHAHKWPDTEMRLSNLTIEQGMRGVQIDRELLNQYIFATHDMKTATEKLLPWLDDSGDDDSWDEFNQKPTSTKCIAEQCRRSGIPCPPVKAHEGEEAYEEWENTYGKIHHWIAALSAWRSVNKLYKTFLTVKDRLRDDGTMPFSLKYYGAHTGRWSGDAKINMQNMRKVPVFCNELGLMETNVKKIDAALKFKKSEKRWPDWVRHAIDFRRLIIPRPGKRMILSDLSQIEPRVMAWVTNNTKLMDLARSGMSIYEAFARTNLGYTGESMSKDSMEYALVKAQVLALGYQAGWEKFLVMGKEYTGVDFAADDPEFIEVDDPVKGGKKTVSGYGQRAKQIVSTFREHSKLTTDLWKKLDDSFKRSIASDFVMSLPSGRKMRYEKVRCEARIIADPETGNPKRKTVFTADVGGKRVESYGGKLTENLIQATARDVFGHHLLRLEDTPGIRVLFSSHDEAITEVDSDVTVKQIEEIMSECPEWIEGCPIAAEAKEVACYEK